MVRILSSTALTSSSFCFCFFVFQSLLCLDAKHVQDKGARWARAKRPRKSRKSDIFRAPTNYPSFEKPPEYTIIMEEGEIALSKVVLPSARTPSKRLTRKEKIAQGN